VTDPRTDRTRQHVLSCTARLLAREGADAVTFSRVSQESRVARSTLYRHWRSRDDLLCTASLPGFSPELLNGQLGMRRFLLNYLLQTGAGLTAPGAQAAFVHALHTAQTNDVLRQNLRLVAESFRRILESRLGPMDSWDHARIIGPVFFQSVVMGEQADGPTLDRWVRDILAMPRHGGAHDEDPDLRPTGTE
jgi:AcrR family transcriptional regulator